MSYNGSGTYIPPAGQPVATGTVIQSATFNTLVTDIGNTFNNVLPRDGQAPMLGQLKIADGSSSVPGIAFNSEASSGMFRPSSGVLALAVSGIESMRINSAGRVLIGTTTDDGTNTLQVSGPAKVSGATTLASTLNVTGATALSSTLSATGNATVGGTFGVTGATTLSSTLGVTGATNLSSVSTSGAATVGTTLGVSGNATVGGTLGVTGATSLSAVSTSGAATVGTTLGVTGATILSSTLGVTGATTLSSTLGVTGATSLSTVSTSGAAIVGTTLGVTGATTLSSTLGVTGATSLSTFSTSGAAIVGTTLAVTGATTLSSTLGVTGATSLSTVSTSGAATVGTTLSVTGNATVGGTLGVTGVLTATSFTGLHNVTQTNEMTMANGFTGGPLWLNYRGATAAITNVNIGNGLATGALATITASNITAAGNVTGTSTNVTGTVAIANGGTGATTAAAALTNLGALPTAGGMMTGTLTFSNNVPLQWKDTGGAARWVMSMDASNNVDIVNAGAGYVQVLNQAGTTGLLKVDNVGNTTVVGKMTAASGQFNGQVLFAEGTSSTPGISFLNDSGNDTGFYHISDGAFGVTCNAIPVAKYTTGGVTVYNEQVIQATTANATNRILQEFQQSNGVARFRLVLDSNDRQSIWTMDTSGNWTGAIGLASGGIQADGAISGSTVTQTSDERKKENWQAASPDLVSHLANIGKAGMFDWIDSKETSLGVGAQSLEQFLPAAVHTDEEGEKTVNYGGAAMVSVVELAKMVLKLEARIAELEGKQ